MIADLLAHDGVVETCELHADFGFMALHGGSVPWWRVLRADEYEHLDLFWAIRGGGGNFGVVTEFEFRLLEVGPMVQFGMLFWGLDDGAADVLTGSAGLDWFLGNQVGGGVRDQVTDLSQYESLYAADLDFIGGN